MNSRNSVLVRTVSLFMMILAVSCDKYEDYVEDFDYSAVYFGSQKPLRTLVARDTSNYLQFKAGVALGGVRENTKGYWVDFMLDSTLLTTIPGAEAFTLLPENCYTMEIQNNRIEIPKGRFIGDFPVKINKSQFMSLVGSTGKTYALPLRITGTSADSILVGDDVVPAKDYTIIVIKYILETQGNYYVMGKQWELNADEEIIAGSEVIYAETDLSQNYTRTMTTLSATELEMGAMGAITGTEETDRALLTFTDQDGVTLSQRSATSNQIIDIASSYDRQNKSFSLNYKYQKGGKQFLVEELLILRQDPETELRYEEW